MNTDTVITTAYEVRTGTGRTIERWADYDSAEEGMWAAQSNGWHAYVVLVEWDGHTWYAQED